METVREQSTAYLRIWFYDKNGELADPVSATYRIDDVDSDEEIRDDTPLTVEDGQAEVRLDKEDNTLLDGSKKKELRRVTISAVYGPTDELHDEFVYEVVNLTGVE